METRYEEQQLELWGGIECTINRVRDTYLEQLRRTGHIGRISDFELFASLGIKALRYPVLWECGPSHASESERWAWTGTALQQLAGVGIRPILGLVHHGSGPKNTGLLDPDFGTKLACYAEQVARRFPEVRDYTPVNEPLTTARFSALYGHWYPHRQDEHSFASALLNQCRAVVLAMESIRRVNPSARLIQTDDLGKIYSTPALAYQAEFENERRWSSYDLLCGRLDRSHRMWRHFRRAGIAEEELEWFLDHRCPPDIIGLNYYLSGERYLDEHLERYPSDTHGGNGKDRYADVLSARVLQGGNPAPDALLREAWERYQRPIAITECHNGCTREEQLRWFLEVWRGAEKARREGAEVVAVTSWSLLGSFDWNSLVTQKNDHYESGVYDIRFPGPRPTALAALLPDLAGGRHPRSPLLEVGGWWRRPRRFVYGIRVDQAGNAAPAPKEDINQDYPEVRPILITGGDGTLARAFARICELRGIPYRAFPRPALDISDAVSVRRAFLQLNPWAVINTAAYTRVDQAEMDTRRCLLENTEGAQLLAQECTLRAIPFLTFSCDLVFNGRKHAAYIEADPAAPLNIYGSSKAEAERLIHSAMPAALIVRSGPLFGPWDQSNFVVRALRALAAEQGFSAANDVIVSPTYVPDLVNACLDLLIDNEDGIWHLANPGEVSWADLARRAAQVAKISSDTLRSCSIDELRLPAARPAYSALTSERGILLPSLDDALNRFYFDCEDQWRIPGPAPQRLAA